MMCGHSFVCQLGGILLTHKGRVRRGLRVFCYADVCIHKRPSINDIHKNVFLHPPYPVCIWHNPPSVLQTSAARVISMQIKPPATVSTHL